MASGGGREYNYSVIEFCGGMFSQIMCGFGVVACVVELKREVPVDGGYVVRKG
jgi:hypothetical protein